MGTSWLRVLNDLMSLPTSCLEQTAVLGERWRRTNVQPKWGSGCLGSVSVPIQPSLWLLLLLQWHTVSCIRHRTKHLLSEKRRERCLKVCIAKNCSAVIWQGAKGPCPLGGKAQGNTRHKGSLERRNIVFHWRFWVSHSLSVWLSTEHTTLPRTSPGLQQLLPRRKSPAGCAGHPGGSAWWLGQAAVPGSLGHWFWPWPPAAQRLVKACWHLPEAWAV